ncbi:MAG: metallophosphoesterase [Acidobacteriota bacterium]
MALVAAGVLVSIAGLPLIAQTGSRIHITHGPEVHKISGSKVTVTWTTDKAKAGSVKWGTSKGHYSKTRTERAATLDHSVEITRLPQNTTFHYKVKTGRAKSRDHTFTTADYSDAPFTFADMGDNRGGSAEDDSQHVTPSFQNIVNAAIAKRPAFTIHVGDLFYGNSDLATTQQMYSVFKAAIQPLIETAAFTQYPFTISPGNHEMHPACSGLGSGNDASCTPAFDPYSLFNQEFPGQPQNGPPGYLGTAFSFTYQNTHVASIDACHYDANAKTSYDDLYDLHDAVIDWLDADLAAAQQALVRHIFVFGHPEAWAPDGIRWTASHSGTQSTLYAVANRAAVGSSGTILSSEDGVNWTAQTSGTTATLRGVAAGSLLVAVGDSGTILTCPLTGSTWTQRASGTVHHLNGVFSGSTLYVAVGNDGTILTSPDGVTWTAETSGTNHNLNAVTQGATEGGHTYYIAVGNGGTILTSHDAKTWTAQASPTTADLGGVTSGSASGMPLFAAVGDAGTILTSQDTLRWSPQVSGVSSNLNAVTCAHIFVVMGDGGAVLTSEDGVEWVSQNSGTRSNLLGIEHWFPDELKASEYTAVGADGAILTCPAWLGVASLGTYKSQRDRFWQVLQAHGVDAYICGHVHIFDDSFTVGGIVQWLDGASGCVRTGNGRWTLWTIDGDTATAQNMDESGNVTYTRVIQSSQP